MGIKIGRNAAQFTASSDTYRFNQADIRAQHATREARVQRRLAKSQLEDEILTKEDSFYGPGIDDFM